MELKDLKAATGFDSFFECYKWLKQINKSNAEHLTITKVSPAIHLSIQEIKASAMDEIYSRLITEKELVCLKSFYWGSSGSASQQTIDKLNNIPLKD